MTVASRQIDDAPVGAGLIGMTKVFTGTLVSGVETSVSFGKWKLSNVDDVCLVFGPAACDNGSGDTFIGVPSTKADIDSDGAGMKLTDAPGGAWSAMVSGIWTYNK